MATNPVSAGPGTARVGRRQVLFGAGGALALAALSSACGGKTLGGSGSGAEGSGTGTVQFWTNHSASEVQVMKSVIATFKQKHPDITINLLNIAEGDKYYTKLNTAAVGGNLADVYFARTFDVPSFVKKQRILAIDDLVARDKGEVTPDDFWPAEIAQMTVDGHLYGLPYDFSNQAVYVNKTLFAARGVELPTADWTWDQFFDIAARFAQNGGRTKRYGARFSLDDWFLMGVLKSNGGEMFSADNSECVVNSPINVEFLTRVEQAMKQGAIPGPDGTPAGVDPFAAQLVAMQIGGSWGTAATRDNVAGKFEWDVIQLPKGTTGRRDVAAAGGLWAIAPNSSNQAAAWAFVKYLAGKDAEKTMIVDPLRSIPGRQSSARDWSEQAKQGGKPPASVEIFRDQMTQDAPKWTYPWYWREFETIWTNRLATLGAGGSPAQILKAVQDDTNKAARG